MLCSPSAGESLIALQLTALPAGWATDTDDPTQNQQITALGKRVSAAPGRDRPEDLRGADRRSSAWTVGGGAALGSTMRHTQRCGSPRNIAAADARSYYLVSEATQVLSRVERGRSAFKDRLSGWSASCTAACDTTRFTTRTAPGTSRRTPPPPPPDPRSRIDSWSPDDLALPGFLHDQPIPTGAQPRSTARPDPPVHAGLTAASTGAQSNSEEPRPHP